MTVPKDHLRSATERIERLHEERKALGDDISDIFAEAKGQGIDVKALKDVIRLRRQEPAERIAHSETVDEYMLALGMLDETGTRPALAPARTKTEAPPPPAEQPATPPAPTKPKLVSSFDPAEIPDIPPELDRRRKAASA